MFGKTHHFRRVKNLSKRPRRQIQGHRRLTSEKLEERRLLEAGGLGDFVFHDLDGDGVKDDSEPGLADVTVRLYRDVDHDLVPEPGGDDGEAVASTTTAGDGSFQFPDPSAGNYFLQVVLPEGFDQFSVRAGAVNSAGLSDVLEWCDSSQRNSFGLVVDNFTDAPWTLTLHEVGTVNEVCTGDGANIAGSEREIEFEYVSGTARIGNRLVFGTLEDGCGYASVSAGPGVVVRASCTWNGPGDNGLGMDLTRGGIDDRFFGRFLSVDQHASLKLTVEDDHGGSAYYSNNGLSEPCLLPYEFADFVGTVDFTNVRSVTVEGTGPEAVDLMIGCLSTGHQSSGWKIGLQGDGPDPPPEPGISVVKEADKTSVAPYEQVTYTYTVTNTGNLPITEVTLTDDNATPDFSADDFTPALVPNGNGNGDATLDVGESWTYTAAVIPPVTVIADGGPNDGQPVGQVVTRVLSSGDYRFDVIYDDSLNDNRWGSGSNDPGLDNPWPGNGRKWSQIIGSDHVKIELENGAGAVVMAFQVDYLTRVANRQDNPVTSQVWAGGIGPGIGEIIGFGSQPNIPQPASGNQNDGTLTAGQSAWFLSTTTSMYQNLQAGFDINNPTYPTTADAYPGENVPDYEYRMIYSFVIDDAAFGSNGFGGLNIPGMHNSPPKGGFPDGDQSTRVKPGTVTNTAVASGVAVSGSATIDVEHSDTATVQIVVAENGGGDSSGGNASGGDSGSSQSDDSGAGGEGGSDKGEKDKEEKKAVQEKTAGETTAVNKTLVQAVDDSVEELLKKVVAAPTVEGVVINDGSEQRSRVTSLTVTFNTVVTIEDGAFHLVNKNSFDVVGVSSTAGVLDGKTVVTVRFVGAGTGFGALADGNYLLTVYADKVHAEGVDLDGDGDGDGGGNYVFGAAEADKFFSFFGDTDGDRDVDREDFSQFRRTYRKKAGHSRYLDYLDYDDDGDVDRTDLQEFRRRYRKSLAWTE